MMTEFGLGRLQATDLRDTAHPMLLSAPAAAEDITNRWKTWWDGTFWPDQGETSQCVEYAWHNFMSTRPVNSPNKAPFWEYGSVYASAQRDYDEWEGEDYDGTSVRAGAKALQALGLISGYRWAWDLETVVRHALFEGPVVMGTNWYTSMFYPNTSGIVEVRGSVEGGHAYAITGVNTRTGLARCKQTWGRGWGKLGRFWIKFDDLARLIDEDGEACIATEVSV